MILDSLRIENFRMFSNFEVPRLGHVNLIVGMNNCGKSTILEAIQIFASQGSPTVLMSIVAGHDETLRTDPDPAVDVSEGTEHAFRHLFPDRSYPAADDAPIVIGDLDRKRFTKIEHKYYVDEFQEVEDSTGETIRRRRRLPVAKSDLFSKEMPTNQALLISHGSRSFWLDLATEPSSGRYRNYIGADNRECPYSLVPTGFLEPDYLADLWDRAALTELEQFVIQALRTIDDSVEGLAFVKKDTSDRTGYRGKGNSRTAIVKIKSSDRPVPLNSMGDGMHRVLQLILAMFSARGGIFLIDEFENGLHYSVQEKVWSLVFELAKMLDVQVFATTHSNDCIGAFSRVALADDSVEGIMFRVARGITPELHGDVIATVFDEAKLERLTAADVEVR